MQNGGYLACAFNDDSGNWFDYQFSSVGLADTDNWHMVSWVNIAREAPQNTNMFLYIDGVLVSSFLDQGTSTATNIGVGTPLQIGQTPYEGSSTPPIDGLLDDLCFWDTTLSETDIQSLYSNGVESVTTPVYRFRFDEGSGTTAEGGASSSYVPTNMVLVSSLMPLPGFDPTAGRPAIYFKGTNAPTTNNVTLLVSKDAGTNWVTCTNFTVNIMNPTNFLAVGTDLSLTNGTWAGTNLWLRVDVSSNYAGTVLGVGMPIGAE